MSKKERIGVIGDGGWGTALALHMQNNGHRVSLWGYDPAYIAQMKKTRVNKKFLPGFRIPRAVTITHDADSVIAENDIIILAVPTQHIRRVMKSLPVENLEKKIIVNVAKGIENKTLWTPVQIVRSFVRKAPLVALSGPSHAEEVARKIPTCVVVASRAQKINERVQAACMAPLFRVYTTKDVLGVEIAGAIKNVIAVAAGMCDGLGYGANTKAALLARSTYEMTSLGAVMGAKRDTFSGLAGMGDLITTCFSPYGRNRAVGEALASGKTIKQVLAKMEMVAEGVHTAKSVHTLSRNVGVEMPICEQVYKVIYHRKSPQTALKDLMMRAPRPENR